MQLKNKRLVMSSSVGIQKLKKLTDRSLENQWIILQIYFYHRHQEHNQLTMHWRCVPWNISTSVQLMSRCLQAPSHWPGQCWSRSRTTYEDPMPRELFHSLLTHDESVYVDGSVVNYGISNIIVLEMLYFTTKTSIHIHEWLNCVNVSC